VAAAASPHSKVLLFASLWSLLQHHGSKSVALVVLARVVLARVVAVAVVQLTWRLMRLDLWLFLPASNPSQCLWQRHRF
jgi:hypothetical protein